MECGAMSDKQGFSIDFHVHTAASFDSMTPPRLAIETARRRGLDGMAVTDHDTIRGAIRAMEANRYDDFLVIPGIEVKSDLGDIIGLYVFSEIRSRKFADVIAEIHEQGGVAYLPHPIRTFGPAVPAVARQHPGIDLWERYNGRYSRREFARADSAFEQLGLERALCGSDAHFPWEIGLLRTHLPEMPSDAQSLVALSAKARLEAMPRGEMGLRSGIALGEATKKLKDREYVALGLLVASLPWKALRRSVRALKPG
jgi:predicted metal-dependent phosphoesterase TrpH